MHDGKTKYAKSGKSGALEDAESQEAEDKARLESYSKWLEAEGKPDESKAA